MPEDLARTNQIGLAPSDTDGQRVGPASAFPGVLRELGIDPVAILGEAGLRPDALDDPDARIAFSALGTLIATAVRRTGCEHLGVLVGQRLGLAQMGRVGELGRTAATVGGALRMVTVHQHLLSRGAMPYLLTEGRYASLAVFIYHPDTTGVEYLYDSIAGMALNIMRDLTTPDWRPDLVCLSRARPASLAPYREAFPAPLEFDAEYTAVRFDAELLERKVPTANPARFAMLEARIAIAQRGSLVNDLRRALRIHLVRGETAADRVAQTLELHRRTLDRRLAEVGTTYQTVLDEVRFDAARHYLLVTGMQLVDIAAALGYSQLSAFERAFRRWSGVAPGRFRKGKQPSSDRPAD